jgi:hypothetical protein
MFIRLRLALQLNTTSLEDMSPAKMRFPGIVFELSIVAIEDQQCFFCGYTYIAFCQHLNIERVATETRLLCILFSIVVKLKIFCNACYFLGYPNSLIQFHMKIAILWRINVTGKNKTT